MAIILPFRPSHIAAMIQWRDHIASQLSSFFENRISKLLIDVIIADQRHQRVKTNDPVKDELIIFEGRFIHGSGSVKSGSKRMVTGVVDPYQGLASMITLIP